MSSESEDDKKIAEQEQRLKDRIKALEDQIKEKYEEKIKELKEDIEVLDLWLTVASENGVFTNLQNGASPNLDENKGCIGVPKSFKEAQDYLKQVWDSLYNEEAGNTGGSSKLSIGDCETRLSKVFEFYNKSVGNLGKRKKILINGGHIIAYLTTMLILTILATLVWNIHNYLNIGIFDNRYGTVIYSATAVGLVGGIVRSMYNIVHEVRLRVFRRASWAEYVMAPFIGGSFAFIITIGIIAGLITGLQPIQLEEQRGEQQSEQQQNIQQPYGLYLIAFATGLFWKNTINRLKSIVGDKDKLEDKNGKITRIE